MLNTKVQSNQIGVPEPHDDFLSRNKGEKTSVLPLASTFPLSSARKKELLLAKDKNRITLKECEGEVKAQYNGERSCPLVW